jgi:Flp pilus assembly protein TadD
VPPRAAHHDDSSSTGRRLLIDLALAGAILLVYAQTLGFDFAKVDDTCYVTANSHVLSGLTPANVAWAFRSFECSNWHPVTWISLMTDAAIGGGKPRTFHATNVALHTINTLLLFHLLAAATRSTAKSALVAALFAIHPLHVESVAWVTERKDLLSTLFWLLAIAAYLAYARWPTWGRYALVIVAFVLGALSKPMVVTLPLTLLLLDVWPLGRLGRLPPAAFRGWTPIVEKIPLLVVSAASCVVTLLAQGPVVASLTAIPLADRLATAVVAYATYAVKSIWPVGLSIHYVFATPIPAWRVATSAIALAGASWLAFACRARRPYITVGWLWYVVTLVPVIGLVQVGEQSIADRYTYVPLIGLFIAVVWGVADVIATLVPSAASKRGAIAVVAGLALAGFAARAHDQTKTWRDPFELFRHAVAVNDKNSLALIGLGQELAARGRDVEAIERYHAALNLRPGATFARWRLAESLERIGKLSEASEQFRELLRIDPGDAQAGRALGILLIQQENLEEAAAVLERARSSHPEDARIHATLGLALTRLQRLEDAERSFDEALRIDPGNVIAHNGIAVVLGRMGRTDEAIAHLERALAADPNLPDARENLERLRRRKMASH